MKKIVLATNNAHKLQELRQMLGNDYEVAGLADIGCHDDIPEDADTFAGNAMCKARYVWEHYGLPCIADDSGLEIDALGGRPGVYSARFAGNHDSAANNALVLKLMQGVDNRRARFRCVICLLDGNGDEHLFEGAVEGEILHSLDGEGGFGYDPLFRPLGWNKSFGRATADEKNAVSHRGRAVEALRRYLEQNILSSTENE